MKEDIENSGAAPVNPAFWDYAASTNMLQAEINNLAAENAHDKKLKSLGKRGARFNKGALRKLRKLTDEMQDVQLPDGLVGADREIVSEFRVLQGPEFDARYRSFLVSSNESQLAWYDDALRRYQDSALRHWIIDMQEHLREQLELLSEIPQVQTPQ